MKCPIDETEMEEGYMANHGMAWMKGSPNLMGKFMQMGVVGVKAYRCPKCGKLELSSEVKTT